MIINRTMNTNVEKLHTFITQMIVQDIENAKECHNIKVSDIKEGYTYSKSILNKTGKEGIVKTRIETLKPGSYEVSFTSSNGINYVEYNYKDIDDITIDLVYEERFESDAKTKSLNHSIMSWFYKRQNKKRAKALLNRIEYLINEQPV